MATQKGYFSSIDSNDIKGGLYQVDTYLDIFKINAASHFKDGMLCYVSAKDTYYQYSAKKKRWCPVNIKRSPVIDTSICIDNVWYSVSAKDNYDDMLQELVHLKYTDEQQRNLAGYMRAYPEIYQNQEEEFQKWFDLSKAAAWEFIYKTPYNFENKEGDPNNKFDYPYLRDTLNTIKRDINYFYAKEHPLIIDISTNEGFPSDENNIYIDYVKQSEQTITMHAIGYRDGELTKIIASSLKSLWDSKQLYNSDTDAFSNLTLTIKNPKIQKYPLLYKATDNEYTDMLQVEKNIVFTLPYFYGCCNRANIASKNKNELSEYTVKKEINNIFRSVKNVINITQDFDLLIDTKPLYWYNLTNKLISQIVLAKINPAFNVMISIDDSEFIGLKTLKNVYDLICNKVYTILIEREAAEYAENGYTINDSLFYILEGAENGSRHVAPQKKIVINNIQDGNFVWICIPSVYYTGNPPKITAGNHPFGLKDTIFDANTNYGDYVCFRSAGDKGLEAHKMELSIQY